MAKMLIGFRIPLKPTLQIANTNFIQIENNKTAAKTEEFLYGNKEERMLIGKESLRRWSLPEAIRQADDGIVKQKNLFLEKKIFFQSSKDYANYLKIVEQNISNFTCLFETS